MAILLTHLKFKSYDEFFSEDSVNINLTLTEIMKDVDGTYSGVISKIILVNLILHWFRSWEAMNSAIANFLRIKYGKGNFFLHTLPLAIYKLSFIEFREQ